jgi:hypothetical protein
MKTTNDKRQARARSALEQGEADGAEATARAQGHLGDSRAIAVAVVCEIWLCSISGSTAHGRASGDALTVTDVNHP